MGELEVKEINKVVQPKIHYDGKFADAEDILFREHNSKLKVSDYMKEDNEYVIGGKTKLNYDGNIEEPPVEEEPEVKKKKKNRIKNFRFVNPLTEADKYALVKTPSEQRRDAVHENYKKTVAHLLKDKKITGDLRTLLEDVKTYLSEEYDAVSMEKRKEEGQQDGMRGLRWLFHSFTHKQRFNRKSQGEKLAYLKEKIDALPKQKTAAVTFLKGWMRRLSLSNLEVKEEDINDATEAEFLYSEKNKSPKAISMKDRRKEPLFAQEPSLADISQGSLGDCYFLANIASLVSVRPDAIRDMMKDEGDTVVVRFYSKAKKVGRIDVEPVYIRVDKKVPQNFAAHSLWVQILEKAFTVYYGISKKLEGEAEITLDKNLKGRKVNYRDIAGGFLEDAFFMLTGKEAETNGNVWNDTTNRIDKLFDVMAMNLTASPECIKKARALPIRARRIRDEYE